MNQNQSAPPQEPAGNPPAAQPADAAPKTEATAAPARADAPGPVPRLFRPIDWLTFAITALIIFLGYVYTQAPNLTLEDSGELAVGSFYAGVPHPPGYPFWSVVTWLFTELIPFGNIAWRVSMADAVAGALACALIALLISRGSSLLIESCSELRDIPRKWENAICLFSGYVGGMLMGFNGFMWSQCVIVEVYSLAVATFMLMSVFLVRWMYAQHQHRYFYLAVFMFGLCLTNHQSLLMAAMGIEVAIIAANPRLGRDILFFVNCPAYLGGLVLKATGHIDLFKSAPGTVNMIFALFNIVGVASILGTIFLVWKNRRVGSELLTVILAGAAWAAGVAFYLFMPLTSMANPPMNWGYARTVEGFVHALTRGQYDKFNPSNMFNEPLRFLVQIWEYFGGMVSEFSLVYLFLALIPLIFLAVHIVREGGAKHLWRIGWASAAMLVALGLVVATAANHPLATRVFWLVFFLAAAVNLWFIMDMGYDHCQRVERSWILGLLGIYFCLSILLLIMLNPSPDRQSQELNRVFFTSSHAQVALCLGYGLALAAAAFLMRPERFRTPGLVLAIVAFAIAFYSAACVCGTPETANDSPSFLTSLLSALIPEASKSWINRFTAIYGIAVAALAVAAFYVKRTHLAMTLLLAVYVCMPVRSILAHWENNEQRGHMFGYWFGHDMFTPPFQDKDGKPLYPEMARDTILFGGTDPGRFAPTYMIFCESFIPPSCRQSCDTNFDRRDVYIITQNALADGTYLNYIRGHYNRSAQIDPPFFQKLFRSNSLSNAVAPLDRYFMGLGDRIEKRRRAGTSYFKPGDFTNLAAFAQKLQSSAAPKALSQFLKENLSPETAQKLGQPDAALAAALAKDLNVLLEKGLLYESNRFAGVTLRDTTAKFLAQNPQSHTRIRLNRLLLEEAFPAELAKSPGGVYPDREIITPSPEDSQISFQQYVEDAGRRYLHDTQLPNEPKQLKPGENVRVENNRVSVGGQASVMAINGLLTKVIFDKNPGHEFYVEESFPLDWMYPYLTPFGIIMKINRNQLPELTPDVVARDHEFWSQYSQRLIGNWITYDTSISNICEFAQRTYLHRDYQGFRGDPAFVRDDDAQKAFCKLRSAQAGLYTWRVSNARNPEERQRMIKETDFAFKQAFAFCPYSPEALFRYVNFIMSFNQAQRLPDAILLTETALRLDPANGAVADLLLKLRSFAPNASAGNAPQQPLTPFENAFRSNPCVSNAFNLANSYMSVQRSNQALGVLLYALRQTNLDVMGAISIANAFAQLGQPVLLEQALARLIQINPANPEAWYDLAGVQVAMGQTTNSLGNLSNAFRLSADRLKLDPKQRDLYKEVMTDPRFEALRQTPEFKKLVEAK